MSYWAIILLAATVQATAAMPQNGYRYYIPQQYAMRRQYYPSFAKIVARAAVPGAAVPVPPGGAAGAGGVPGLAVIPAQPHSGITGFGDNFGAGIANFGNGQGAALDALISGSFNAAGVLISGILGSGAVNTAFANFNNKPPQGAQVATPPPAAAPGATGAGGASGAAPGGAGGAPPAAGGGGTPPAPADPNAAGGGSRR